MILLDANLLIYAVNADAPLHGKAKSWLESALSGQETVGFSWNVLLAFLRLTTRPGLFRHPLPVDTAFDLVAAWLDRKCAVIVHPGPRHLQILRELLRPLAPGESHIRRSPGGPGHRAPGGTLFLGYRLREIPWPEVAQPCRLSSMLSDSLLV